MIQTTPIGDLFVRALHFQTLAVGYMYPDRPQRERLQHLLDVVDGGATSVAQHPVDLEALTASVRDACWADVEVDFNRLFSGGVACPPHQTAYEPDIFRRQRALADLAGFHAAFGFELPPGSRWQVDHIGVELEFCAVLLQRQLTAVEEGWHDQATVCRDALVSFLDDHLGRWTAAFTHHLEHTADTAYYRCLAQVTNTVVATELARWRLQPEPLADRPRSLSDDAPPTCGGCPVPTPGDGIAM